jgi:predicted phosphodiesterase
MKIAYASDLHFEFEPLILEEIESADVLVLAGDILNVSKFKRYTESNRTVDTDGITNFFDAVTSKFKHVLMVMGNHEYYGSYINEAVTTLRELLPYKNFHILDGEYIVIDNNLFVGGTLWTDYNNEDPFTLMRAPTLINDYRVIYNGDTRITVADILERHKHFVKWVEQVDKSGYDNNILITHHSPSRKTTADHYKHDNTMNGLFGSNLDYLLTNFDYAIFGHQHDPKTPIVNECMLLNNSRGYPFESMHSGFKLKYITI